MEDVVVFSARSTVRSVSTRSTVAWAFLASKNTTIIDLVEWIWAMIDTIVLMEYWV
jgi:hypothetical protein